eukprot:GHRR01033199.1.p1 GENE.GHRR01033199.1~~GHRR01033199.1.p1  ORF type:complete len:102 (-),score=14.71 GHRR01033199.1:851-1156(-)
MTIAANHMAIGLALRPSCCGLAPFAMGLSPAGASGLFHCTSRSTIRPKPNTCLTRMATYTNLCQWWSCSKASLHEALLDPQLLAAVQALLAADCQLVIVSC